MGDNSSTASITGDSNNVSVTQAVLDNTADLMIDGDSNTLNVWQAGISNNQITADIYGDDNNTAGNFSGAAAGALGISGLQAGDLVQIGYNNDIDLNVGTAGAESNDNLFAFRQYGSDNAIEATIKGGDNNQAVIVQAGSSNFTSLVQNGSNNNAGITQ